MPDAATVAASGDAPMLEETGRRAWAGWLLGALLVYGVLPRVVLALLCAAAWRRSVRSLQLDLSQPGYARLRPLLLPDSERMGVRDPAPALMPRPQRHAVALAGAGSPVLLALELGSDVAWPPALQSREKIDGRDSVGQGVPTFAAFDAGQLDSREQRSLALARFAAQPPCRLLIAVDPRRTPDRGNLGVIAELADHAVEVRIWALGGDAPAEATRLPLWREGLTRLGLPSDALILDAEAAHDWLAGRALEPSP